MDALGWTESWFVQLAAQSFICLALGLWLASWLGSRPARAHAVLLLAIIAALLSPVAGLLVKATNNGLFLASPDANLLVLTGEPGGLSNDADGLSFWTVPVELWIVGSLSLSYGIAVSFLRGRRLVASAEPVTDVRLLTALEAARTILGLRVTPELRGHPQIASPMVWAFGPRPVALIPDEARLRTDDIDWESVFIHELAHVKRRDHFAGLFADVVAALLWWNPVIWWARRRLARESEFACDDQIAAAARSPVDFAESLLALRSEALLPRIPATSLTGRQSWLKARVRRLLQDSDRPHDSIGPVWLASALSLTAIAVIGLALSQTRQIPRPEESFARPLRAVPQETVLLAP